MNEIAIEVSGHWQGESDERAKGRRIRLTREIGLETDVAIVGTAPIDIERVMHLRGLVRLGVGFDNVPADALRKAGVVLAYTPNAPSQSVAEHALGLMLAALRFRDRERPGRTLSEISVAVIGRGRIGKRFAALLSRLSVDIMAVDPVADTTFDEIHRVVIYDLDTALASADVVSMHVPLTDDTRGMICRKTLRRMKRDAVLINTARGGVVNEADLFDHLAAFPEFTAALDVFETEPYAGPLLSLKNCITTPHVASMTLPARRRMEREAIEAAIEIIDGRSPRWEIPEVMPWE